MTTSKKAHNLDKEDIYLKRLLKEYTYVVRFAYNRILDGTTSQSDLERIVKEKMNNIDNIDSSLIKCAIQKAKSMDASIKEIEKKGKIKISPIFGSRDIFFQRKYLKITKEEYISNRLYDIWVRGATNDGGNRKFDLIINSKEDSKIIFKPKCGIKYEIPLKLSKNEYRIFKYIYDNKLSFTVSIDLENVFISYDENLINIIEPYFKVKDRILSFDLNPNYVGLVIKDYRRNKILEESVISIKDYDKSSSDDKTFIYDINKKILSLCSQYNVEYVAFEDLNITSKDHGKGKWFNKLVNQWDRNTFINNMKKHLNLNKIKYEEVPCHYSSFEGAIENPDKVDQVAAAIEIGYRLYKKNKIKAIKEKNGEVILRKEENGIYWSIIKRDYKDLSLYLSSTRWKKMMIENAPTSNNLLDYYESIKQTKWRHSYRLVFDPSKVNCFKLNRGNDNIVIYYHFD